jgi:uncharacterized membrane protein
MTVSNDPLARVAEQQNWLSAAQEKSLQEGVTGLVTSIGGDSLRRALHGDWLHEPLHAILTDVPVGSWSATVIFDSIAAFTRSASLDQAADATLCLGILGASAAAATGMNDWAEIKSPAARRIGLVHATLNVAATAIFICSGVARRKKARSWGRALAATGLVLVAASAHLGGNLVYEHRIGVQEPARGSSVTDEMQK